MSKVNGRVYEQGLIMLMYKHGDDFIPSEHIRATSDTVYTICMQRHAETDILDGLEQVCDRSAKEEGTTDVALKEAGCEQGKRESQMDRGDQEESRPDVGLIDLNDAQFIYVRFEYILSKNTGDTQAIAAATVPGTPIGFIDFTAQWRNENNRYLTSLAR